MAVRSFAEHERSHLSTLQHLKILSPKNIQLVNDISSLFKKAAHRHRSAFVCDHTNKSSTPQWCSVVFFYLQSKISLNMLQANGL